MAWPDRIDRITADLFPGYFAVTMTAGALALASHQRGWSVAADVLYQLAAITYLVVGALMIWRLVRHRQRFVADLISADRGFALLTAVVGANVLGAGATVIHARGGVGWVLWWLAATAWLGLTTVVLTGLVVNRTTPETEPRFNGTWFLIPVGAQSSVVLGALQLHRHPDERLALVLIGLFVLALTIYPLLLTALVGQLVFGATDPKSLSPSAWIGAGALFISTLAGSNLLAARTTSDLVERVSPAIEAFTVGALALATALVPLLVGLGVWRHVVCRVPVRYHPAYWTMAFPVAMFALSSRSYLAVAGIDGFDGATTAALVAAFVVSGLCTLGLAAQMLRGSMN